jgi:hypothetical protein
MKIKLEDKAAFLNRMGKMKTPVSTSEIKTNEIGKFFEFISSNPLKIKNAKYVINQSPKINIVKEMKNTQINKTKLKEIIL